MRGMDGGKLSEVMPGLRLEDNELVSKFKMTASDLVSVRGQVMEYTYTYIPTVKIRCVLKAVTAGSKRLTALCT